MAAATATTTHWYSPFVKVVQVVGKVLANPITLSVATAIPGVGLGVKVATAVATAITQTQEAKGAASGPEKLADVQGAIQDWLQVENSALAFSGMKLDYDHAVLDQIIEGQLAVQKLIAEFLPTMKPVKIAE